MLLCGGGRSITKTMWLLICVCIFFSASVISEIPTFNKCCSKNSSLIKVIVVLNETTEVKYECLDSDTERHFIIPSTVAPLIVDDNIRINYGIPKDCELETLSTYDTKVGLPTKNDACYDRFVMEVVNGSSKNIIPKIVALTCLDDKTNDTSNGIIPINKITKCCLAGQGYDTEYHACRDVDEVNDEKWLINKIKKKNGSLYEVDINLQCKFNEYAVELSEDKFMFDVDGNFLKVTSRDGMHQSVSTQGSWCMDRGYSTKEMVARVCTPNCSTYGAYCLRKCCPIGEHYKPRRCGSFVSKCVRNDDDSVLFNISAYMDPLRSHYSNIEDVIGIRTSLTCSAGKIGFNRTDPQDHHYLTRSGHLHSPIGSTNDYCVDIFDTRDCGIDVTLTALICFIKPSTQVKDFRISFVLISISSVCLALTLLVYCSLPELRNQHGRTLICHLSTMLLAFSCLARVQYGLVEDVLLCTLLGYGMYFGFVAAFAWLNVMCFDIWWTFGSIRTVRPMRKANAEKKRFIWYSIYAWSAAILLTLTTYLLDKYPVSPILDSNIGSDMCWFGSLQNDKTDWPHYIFFVIPMGVITCVNFVLWILTARHCARVKSEVHRLQAGSVGDRVKRRFRVDRAKYILTGKLWVVMGAGWVSEMLSTLTQEPQWLWSIIDLFNELQGVFILIILIFKPKLYYLIRKRLGLEKPDSQKNGTASSARTSSTFLSRTISHDERATLRISQPNNVKQK